MRPYLNVGDSDWETEFLKIVDAPNICNRFSENKLYAMFVAKYGCYPTINQFVYFAWKRLVKSGSHKTLLPDVFEFAEMVVERFAKVTQSVDPKEFTIRFDKSMSKVTRAEIERS